MNPETSLFGSIIWKFFTQRHTSGTSYLFYYHRQHLVEQLAKYTHKMQKTLRLMNVRLDVAIRDITGKSGLAIIDAILSGSRDPHYLASLVDIRMKKTKEEIAESPHGWWRDELLFELGASLEFYRLYEKAFQECDMVIEKALLKFAPLSTPLESDVEKPNRRKKKSSKNAPEFNVSSIAWQYFRTDLFAISGISYSTVLCLLTTMGDDIHKIPIRKKLRQLAPPGPQQ